MGSTEDGSGSYHFDYGLDGGYGHSTPVQPVSFADQPARHVSAPVSGLAPGSTYHYRLCAEDAEAGLCTRDQTFLTVEDGAPAAFAYVPSSAGRVHQLALGPLGSMKALSPPSVASDIDQLEVVASPDGGSLYGRGDQTIRQWDIAGGGTLTPKSPAAAAIADGGPIGIAMSPTGRALYALLPEGIQRLPIGAGGRLGAPETPVPAGGFPRSLDTTPNGRRVYAADYDGASVHQFAADADGRLTPLSPATVASGFSPYDLVVSPDGTSVFVVSRSGGTTDLIQRYRVGADGTLDLVARADAQFRSTLVVSPDGNTLYAVSADADRIDVYKVGGDEILGPYPSLGANTGNEPSGGAFGPGGGTLFVTSDLDGTLTRYRVGTDGRLTAEAPVLPVSRAGSGLVIVPAP